ncbi:MAG TPA: response regulator transcription factor [Paludibacter sp.]|nr:response regulator transcription factor [Paludibacter sp.]
MNTKLKCLLLDDELPGLTYLKMLCEQVPELEVVKAFNRPDVFLSELAGLDFDLCILDIEMPQINGIQLAELLKGKLIIFTTAHKEYAAEAFDLDAVDFVRKPIQLERLQKAVRKAIKQVNDAKHSKKFIHLNTDKGKSLIVFDQLCYIKSSGIDSRDKDVLLKDGSKICLKNISFEKLQSILPQKNFCRINKQEIIAIDIVQHFSFDQITSTIPGEQNKPLMFYLSEVYRNAFLEKVKI